MSKTPFKKFSSKDTVDAVKVDEENIDELATYLRGGTKYQSDIAQVLLVPTLTGVLEIPVGDYVAVDSNGQVWTCTKEAFEEDYIVPKKRQKKDEALEDFDIDFNTVAILTQEKGLTNE